MNSVKYSWRHDNVLRHVESYIDKNKYSVYIDLKQKGEKVLTIPPDILVTTLIPDMVIIDKNEKSCDIFELTCPAETRIDIAHELKMNKYAHFTSDIKYYKTKVTAFEIGSHTGLLTSDNKKRLSDMFRFCRKGLKKKTFLQNISAIVMLGSYHLFSCREEPKWNENTNPILGPLKYNK